MNARSTTLAKHFGPKRGEIGLAKFHRMLGYASFFAAGLLMLASFTALHWFGGIIGLPDVARVAVAIAIEVMAASLASSATTARRESGRVDWSAWTGFAFFISIAAYANIMHVIVSLTGGAAAPPGLPAGFEITTEFVVAACVFAAACPLGGTWGVHRFGWLRAHGADAQWTDTADGVIVTNASTGQGKKRASTVKDAKDTKGATSASASASDERSSASASDEPPPSASGEREQTGTTSRVPDEWARARELFDAAIARDPHTKPDAAAIHREAKVPKHVSRTRGKVKVWFAEHQADRRREVHLADPPKDTNSAEWVNDEQEANVA